jgi:branched-chain amino acid transport system substrate-binding protein
MGKKFTFVLSLFLAITVHVTLPDPVKGENLVIGVLLPLSGSNAIVGHMQKKAMLLAIDEINRKGVITGGRILELDIRNAGRRSEDTRNVVNHFIRDKKYPVIISGGGSRAASEAALWCQRGFTPLIIITGSEDSITRDGLDYVFRIAPPRSHYCDAAMEFTRGIIRPDNVALIVEKSEFGKSMTKVIRNVAAEERWDLVYEESIDPGKADLTDVNAGLSATKADTVFLAVFPPDTTQIMEAIRAAGFQEQQVVSLAPSSATESAFTACGEDCRGVYSSALWFDRAETSADSFRERYVERHGTQPDYHAAQAYTAILAAASALRNADETDRETVRNSLKQTRIGSPYGTITFTDWDGFTNQNRPTSYLFQWIGDRFEVVWPERYRTIEPLR